MRNISKILLRLQKKAGDTLASGAGDGQLRARGLLSVGPMTLVPWPALAFGAAGIFFGLKKDLRDRQFILQLNHLLSNK